MAKMIKRMKEWSGVKVPNYYLELKNKTIIGYIHSNGKYNRDSDLTFKSKNLTGIMIFRNKEVTIVEIGHNEKPFLDWLSGGGHNRNIISSREESWIITLNEDEFDQEELSALIGIIQQKENYDRDKDTKDYLEKVWKFANKNEAILTQTLEKIERLYLERVDPSVKKELGIE